jgi:hypothetical protein
MTIEQMDLLQSKLKSASEASHIWWGVSAENRKHGIPRVDHLRQAPSRVRFLSAEPLLEDLGPISSGAVRSRTRFRLSQHRSWLPRAAVVIPLLGMLQFIHEVREAVDGGKDFHQRHKAAVGKNIAVRAPRRSLPGWASRGRSCRSSWI